MDRPSLASIVFGKKQQQPKSRPTPSTSALGSLSAEGWELAMASLISEVDKALAEPAGGIYWMNKAEKHLNRLHAECATKSLASQTREGDVLACQLHVLHGWCQVGRSNPENRLATERATHVFWNVLQRSKTPWWREQDNQRSLALANSFLDLLEIFAKKEFITGNELDVATILMTWNDLPSLPFQVQELAPMYGFLMQQVEMAGKGQSLRQLEQQWKLISDEDVRQWYVQLEPEKTEEESEEIAEEVEPREHSINPSLSSFESERMFKETMALIEIENRNEKESERLQKLISQWESLVFSGATEGKEIVHEILDYYARMGETTNAIKWLGKLDLSGSSDVPKGLNQLIISLANDKDPSAIFRADEILKLLDSSGGGKSLEPAAYAALAERWMGSNEVQSRRRAMELCFRQEKLDAKLVIVMLRLLRREGKENATEPLNQILEWYKEENQSLSAESRREIVGLLLPILQIHGEVLHGYEFLKTEINAGHAMDEKLCELMIASVPQRADPKQIIEVYRLLNQKGVDLGMSFFLKAFQRLADLQKVDRLDQLVFLVEEVLGRVNSRKIDPADSKLGVFLDSIFRLVCFWGRDNFALWLLFLVERSDVERIPMSCYNRIARLLSWKEHVPYEKRMSRIQRLYDRLMKRFHAGDKLSHPDCEFYTSYLNALKINVKTGHFRKENPLFMEQLALLGELRQHYESTQDPTFKPTVRMYQIIMSSLFQMKPEEENALLAHALLEEMIALEAFDREDAEPFPAAMYIVWRCQRTDRFQTIVGILRMMKQNRIAESDHMTLNVLRGCGCSQGHAERQEALLLTTSVLGEFRARNRGRVSPQGSEIYLMAIDSILRNFDRSDVKFPAVMERVFRLCCQDGYLTPEILTKVGTSESVSENLYHQLYNSYVLEGGDPEEWNRNVLARDLLLAEATSASLPLARG